MRKHGKLSFLNIVGYRTVNMICLYIVQDELFGHLLDPMLSRAGENVDKALPNSFLHSCNPSNFVLVDTVR